MLAEALAYALKAFLPAELGLRVELIRIADDLFLEALWGVYPWRKGDTTCLDLLARQSAPRVSLSDPSMSGQPQATQQLCT